MADKESTYPEGATLGGTHDQPTESAGDGEAALRATIDEHGDALAAAVDTTDEFEDLLTTMILVLAAADEEDLEYLTTSSGNLVRAIDGLTTERAAALAETVGEDAAELERTLETVLDLQRQGHLDDLVALAGAFSESLSPAELQELAGMLEENGADLVDALDVVLELHREDHLQDLVELAKTFSALDVDEDTARGLNRVLGAVGEAERESEPVSLLGLLRGVRGADARAGLGYLLAILKAQGRRLRER